MITVFIIVALSALVLGFLYLTVIQYLSIQFLREDVADADLLNTELMQQRELDLILLRGLTHDNEALRIDNRRYTANNNNLRGVNRLLSDELARLKLAFKQPVEADTIEKYN